MSGITKVLFNPLALVRESLDFTQGWFVSRSWLSSLALGFPFGGTALASIVLFILGASESHESKLNRYLAAAEKAAPIKAEVAPVPKTIENEEVPAAVPEEPTTSEVGADAILYFRRILELENENKRARYYVAIRQESQGALSQARKSMETLAPSKSAGYEPAHSWLAIDMLRQLSKGIKVDTRKLEHHLSVAGNWDQAPPRLLFTYAEFLAQKRGDNWQKAALDFVQRAVVRDKTLLIAGARFAKIAGSNSLSNNYAERAALYYSRRLLDDETSELDRLNLAVAYALKTEMESAKKTLQQGMAIANQNQKSTANYQRLYSEICIEQYKTSLSVDEKNFSANWGYLNEAIAIDPWNPKIGEQIAILMEKEITLTDQFREAVQKQVAEGKASPLTYLILGIIEVKKDDPEEGKKYLTLAYKHAPRWPLAINNLGMVLTMIKPPDLVEAQKLIDSGIELDPNNAELHDSRGRILMMVNNPVDATKSFDDALRCDPNREDTRKALIEAYQKQGLPDMAEVQRKTLLQLQAAKREKANNQ